MVIVSQIDRIGKMRGIITTLHKRGAMFLPVATPIVYEKCEEFRGDLGEITENNACYADYKKALEETITQGYARLVGP